MKIALLGLAGAGKDTTAELIHKLTNHDFKIDRFAAPLKRAAEYVFGPTFDERDEKNLQHKWRSTPKADRGVQAAYDMCQSLHFTDAELDKAGELYFEVIDPKLMLSPREYQQLLGTEVVRHVNEHAFVDRIKKLEGNWAIPDARFANELLDVNVFVYKPDLEFLPHESEKLAQELQCMVQEHQPVMQLLHPQYGIIRVLYNTGTIDDLESDVKYLLNTL